MELSADERRLLDGGAGPAPAMAMAVITRMGELAGAARLIPITGAHIDSCLYHGSVGLDFAERLVAGGGQVQVPTTLNVSALDLLHPSLVRLDDATRDLARRLMDAYIALGCQPTWTCAPYQLPSRPSQGEHVAWAESNAIVFANSVLGARTDRYGDFIDVCAALVGRVPLAGLHLDRERRARICFTLSDAVRERAAASRSNAELCGLIGHIVGRQSGTLVPVLDGLPERTTEDDLKALGAAAASSGSVGLCHVVGVTPEADTLADACAGREPERTVEIDTTMLARAWHEMTTWDGQSPLAAVSVGTPHFSAAELAELDRLLAGRFVDRRVEVYVSTGRDIASSIAVGGIIERLARAGVSIVVDTCTYVTPIVRAGRGAVVMTDSAKWAWYGPGNLGVQVVYGSLADCVESAVSGRVVRERPRYLDG